MASVNLKEGKLHGAGEACAQFLHDCREERMVRRHSNEHINPAITPDNWSIKGLTYRELKARYTARVAEVDRTAVNRRKDRVTCMCGVVPVPGGMTDAQAREWYKDVWDVFERHYGRDNMLDAYIHVDEKHQYLDPDTKELRWSRTHAHVFFIPERNGNFDAKHIITRAEMVSLNRDIDVLTRERYNMPFLDGTKAKSRGTVEYLKRQSDLAVLELQEERVRASIDQQEQVLAERRREAQRASQSAREAIEQANQIVERNQQLITREAQERPQTKRKLGGREVVEVDPDVYARMQDAAARVREADNIVVERDSILDKARQQAASIVKQAEQRANSFDERSARVDLDRIKAEWPEIAKCFSRRGVYQSRKWGERDHMHDRDRGYSHDR